MKEVKQVACGVPWCVALTEGSDQYCVVHKDDRVRTALPPPVKHELEALFREAMAK